MTLLKIFFIIGLSTFYFQGSAQKSHMIGVDFATNVSNIKRNFETQNGKPLISLGGGINYRYNFSRIFHIEVNTFYSRFGYAYKNIYTDLTGSPTGVETITKVKFHYVNIPIKAGLSIGRKVSFIGNIGIAPSFLLKSQYNLEAIPNGPTQTIDFTDDVKAFNLFILAEGGAQAKISKKILISLTAMYQFSPMTYSKYKSNISEDLKHFGMTGILGIRYFFHFYNITATTPDWSN